VALAAVAGGTGSIGLMTDVLLGPTRDPVLLAKQAASLTQLSGGRLTLGLGVGAREDDYAVVGRDFHSRGRDWDRALEVMDAVWRGEAPVGTVRASAPVGDGQGRPRLLFGGASAAAIRRTVRWGAGWTASSSAGSTLPMLVEKVRAAWREAGREGAPWISALSYFAVGDDPRSAAFLADYYGPDRGAIISQSLPTTPDALRAMSRRLEDAGVDEMVTFPTLPGIDQVDRLADALLR
jgi:alkanesulfonate monooxygenase SsuD/methylene tetrahydromethanopterin reductase-like flavin-dependent oxidoreductase (luciferase family)